MYCSGLQNPNDFCSNGLCACAHQKLLEELRTWSNSCFAFYIHHQRRKIHSKIKRLCVRKEDDWLSESSSSARCITFRRRSYKKGYNVHCPPSTFSVSCRAPFVSLILAHFWEQQRGFLQGQVSRRRKQKIPKVVGPRSTFGTRGATEPREAQFFWKTSFEKPPFLVLRWPDSRESIRRFARIA